MLGVETGEEFSVKRPTGVCKRYHFSEKYLLGDTNDICDNTLGCLLNGSLEVTKLPWRPEIGEKYWSYSAEAGLVTWLLWSNRFIDRLRFKNKLVFRTEEEAQAHAADTVNWLAGEP